MKADVLSTHAHSKTTNSTCQAAMAWHGPLHATFGPCYNTCALRLHSTVATMQKQFVLSVRAFAYLTAHIDITELPNVVYAVPARHTLGPHS